MMTWIFVALIGPMLHAFSNIMDRYLTDVVFKNVWVQVFYTTFFWIFFLPFIFFIEIPGIPPLRFFPFLFLIGVLELAYVYPYLKALRHDDTSVVSSLFSLGKIFVPLLAFLFLGEVLHGIQYFGFFLIIVSSAALTLTDYRRFRFNRSFVYMFFSSLFLAIEAVIYGGLFQELTWSTAFFWSNICSFVIMLFCLIFWPNFRRDILVQAPLLKGKLWLLIGNEITVFGGTAATILAISLAPAVTLAKTIESLQPLFVVLYTLIFRKLYPQLFRETLGGQRILTKIILFVLMVAGGVLAVR